MKDLEFIENEKAEMTYDIIAGILSVLAVLVVMLQFSDSLTIEEINMVNVADNIIYIIFALDYVVRLITSKDKKFFLKNNVVDLVAILPYSLFSESTYGSIFKLIRVATYILRLIGSIKEILFTNGFIYALGTTVLITILGSIGIYVFEGGVGENIDSYGDALWWSFVTVTTVGYGDISPTTNPGRVIACILMLTGIGVLSMLTSTISTFFFQTIQNNKDKSIKLNIELEKNILDISDLDEEKRKNIISYYEFLKSKD